MIEKIKINNQIVEPDSDGIADVGLVLTEHQSLDGLIRKNRVIVLTTTAWESIKDNPDPDTFYFIIEN